MNGLCNQCLELTMMISLRPSIGLRLPGLRPLIADHDDQLEIWIRRGLLRATNCPGFMMDFMLKIQ